MKYIVIQKWVYTVDIEVDAETESEALQKADSMEGDRNHDDFLEDATVREA